MSCEGCHSDPHELWCGKNPAAEQAMSLGDLYSFTGTAMVNHNVHESKPACIQHDDGSYQLVGSASVAFVRGQFMLVINPVGDRVG